MPQTTVHLTEQNSQRLQQMVARMGLPADELVNKAIELLDDRSDLEESSRFAEWRAALDEVQGMWADRDDLPDFTSIRSSMDRDFWER